VAELQKDARRDRRRTRLKYSAGGLSHEKLMHSIDLYGRQVIPLVRKILTEDIRGKAV
jgi:hypothetical protein